MSKEYIERKALLARYDAEHVGPPGRARELMATAPAADVTPVVHGRWICINKRYGEYECSVCHGVDANCSDYYGIHAVTEQEFCPNCGAKMDKEETNELDKRKG
jgi:hypothetical protein